MHNTKPYIRTVEEKKKNAYISILSRVQRKYPECDFNYQVELTKKILNQRYGKS